MIKKEISIVLNKLKILIAKITRGKLFYEVYFTFLNEKLKFKNNKEVWEKLSPVYISYYKKPPDKKFLDVVITHSSSKIVKILEYGCSSGMNLNYLYNSCGLINLYGIDISEIAIKNGKVRNQNLNLIIGNLINPSQTLIEKLGKDFDIIFTRAVLQHISSEDLLKVLINFKKIMKNKAFLILSECNRLDIPFGRIIGHRVYNTYNHNWNEILPKYGFKMKEINFKYIVATNF